MRGQESICHEFVNFLAGHVKARIMQLGIPIAFFGLAFGHGFGAI